MWCCYIFCFKCCLGTANRLRFMYGWPGSRTLLNLVPPCEARRTGTASNKSSQSAYHLYISIALHGVFITCTSCYIPPFTRGQDGLLCPSQAGRPVQEQVQHAQVSPCRPFLQQGRHCASSVCQARGPYYYYIAKGVILGQTRSPLDSYTYQ